MNSSVGATNNSRARISERLNEVAKVRNYGPSEKMSLEKIYRTTDKAIIAEAVTNPANIPVMKKDRKSTRLNSSHSAKSRMPSSA